mmetsp:Transcript_41308/g.68925  ORF Transcript_41308/g.68925 Transcript_41308/m.68925 type:complete len:101 (-) Transcript_41308:817-1119(-)
MIHSNTALGKSQANTANTLASTPGLYRVRGLGETSACSIEDITGSSDSGFGNLPKFSIKLFTATPYRSRCFALPRNASFPASNFDVVISDLNAPGATCDT